MEFSRQKLPLSFFFVLLLVTTEMGGMVMVAEARHCESQSHRFKGMCVRGSNCANVCQTEASPTASARLKASTAAASAAKSASHSLLAAAASSAAAHASSSAASAS
uniref:Knottins-like domain-containing protein n=1 Tax=Ananas comosus var. bracteatus TaxID=296719 RepID=A0A6V7PZN6_ANACO|nr:unnamed protein product [Ananas comosus var. bracteatus]